MAGSASLAERLSADLGVDLVVRAAVRPLPLRALSTGEREIYHGLPAAPVRRREWLRGRAALRQVLAALGAADDTAHVEFPNPHVSLAHTGGVALAVGCGPGAGLGIDVERPRPLRPATARFFLDPAELEWVSGLAGEQRGRELLRLWTVKEAVYKADPDNGHRDLYHYALVAPGARTGLARAGDHCWSYATTLWSSPVGEPLLVTAAHDC